MRRAESEVVEKSVGLPTIREWMRWKKLDGHRIRELSVRAAGVGALIVVALLLGAVIGSL